MRCFHEYGEASMAQETLICTLVAVSSSRLGTLPGVAVCRRYAVAHAAFARATNYAQAAEKAPQLP